MIQSNIIFYLIQDGCMPTDLGSFSVGRGQPQRCAGKTLLGPEASMMTSPKSTLRPPRSGLVRNPRALGLQAYAQYLSCSLRYMNVAWFGLVRASAQQEPRRR